MSKFTKGHYSCPEAIGPSNFLLITINLFIESWDISDKKKWLNLQRAISPEICFRIYSKVNQVIFSSLPIYSSSHEALSSNSIWDILLTREKCPNLLLKYFFRIYSKVNQVIYSSLPINSPSFKALTPTVFKIFANKVKMPKITKGHYSWSFFFQNLFKS